MKWRAYIRYFRPNVTENSFFAMVDEKILLDYEIYWFARSDIIKLIEVTEQDFYKNPVPLEYAMVNCRYWKLSVYRNGETLCVKNIGEQPV